MGGGWRRATILAGLALGGGPAWAETTVLERAGVWKAYVTVDTSGGTLCGISQFTGPYGLMIKLNREGAFIHLRKDSWNVPKSARMTVSFSIDARHVWTGRFSGTRYPDMIEASFRNAEELFGFLQAFAWGNWLTIRFHDGDEGLWRTGLAGTLRVSRAFLGCAAALDWASAPTQPFDSAPRPSPQPWGSAPQPARPVPPSQPFSGGRAF